MKVFSTTIPLSPKFLLRCIEKDRFMTRIISTDNDVRLALSDLITKQVFVNKYKTEKKAIERIFETIRLFRDNGRRMSAGQRINYGTDSVLMEDVLSIMKGMEKNAPNKYIILDRLQKCLEDIANNKSTGKCDIALALEKIVDYNVKVHKGMTEKMVWECILKHIRMLRDNGYRSYVEKKMHDGTIVRQLHDAIEQIDGDWHISGWNDSTFDSVERIANENIQDGNVAVEIYKDIDPVSGYSYRYLFDTAIKLAGDNNRAVDDVMLQICDALTTLEGYASASKNVGE